MAWAAASQPSGVPQPSWSGAIAHPKEWATLRLTHFAARRRRVFPTAMGRTPPFSFPKGIRVAPKKTCLTEGSVPPRSTRLIKAVKDWRSLTPGPSADGLVRSFRCCGRRPSGPPADPLGKERIASATSFTDTVAWVVCSSGGGGLRDSG